MAVALSNIKVQMYFLQAGIVFADFLEPDTDFWGQMSGWDRPVHRVKSPVGITKNPLYQRYYPVRFPKYPAAQHKNPGFLNDRTCYLPVLS